MDFETRCIHGGRKVPDQYGSVATPLYQTATFAHSGVGETGAEGTYDYTRQQNPTREQLENIIADLEEADDAIAFASGMAAITTLMQLFLPGDRVVCSGDLYGGTYRYFDQVLSPLGIKFEYGRSTETIIYQISEGDTAAVYLETPTNPMMNIFDIEKIAAAAHEAGSIFIVDNTFLTPYFQKPLTLGADIVLHSGSKFLGGHNDTIAGLLAIKGEELVEKLRFLSKTIGAGLSPFDSFLLIRGIKTLPLRLNHSQESALKIAEWLNDQKEVSAVYYPGLPDSKDYELSVRQTSGFGAMISFSVSSESLARHILGAVQLIQFAESLGGTESLITYPVMQTHADIPEEERRSIGIDEKLLRLSVGVESAEDLIADLKSALDCGSGAAMTEW
jgi:cystathionine beta-lyase/cystathionine gamma-synthase